MIYFHASTRGFHLSPVPDSKPISKEEHLALLEGQSNGQMIGSTEDGLPLLVSPSQPTQQERLQALHQQKVDLLNRSCEASITGGFWSDALGERYQYSSQLDDQLNLTGAILAGVDTPYPCRDEAGDKAFRAHSIAQIRQVGDDFTAFKTQLLQKANQLKQQLDQALVDVDLAKLERVTWESAL
ncbi:hypothetical protein IM720_24385 [Pseudomonas fluorescens]|uniref:DUF4376 domain-containing protein n=1 Tax=Pseudomonas fluorescens TaxID=294 RepID=A0A7M2J446_PSEFL|nr:hypothetical protein [Pseudomonas fluorescens]QOU03813.1 hypothetical protein IM720_24385 [Pseudomonas fluorescens]